MMTYKTILGKTLRFDTGTLSWVPWDGAVSGGGGAGGGAVTVADGADVAEGALADAAIVTNASGSLSAKLRGVVALLASVITGGKVSVDGSSVTQPVSAASLPLPALAATSTKQSDGTQKTQIVDGSGNVIGATANALDINIKSGNPAAIQANAGTNLNTSALALEAGNLATLTAKDFATQTTLATRLSESDFDTKTGSLTETAPATDVASSGLNGRLQRIAQRITSLIAAIGSPFQTGGSIGNTAFQANAGTNLNTSALALEGGNLALIKANVDPLGALNSDRVVLTKFGATQLPSQVCRTAVITALETNNGVLVVGDPNTQALPLQQRRGTPLWPGDVLKINVDNLSRLYCDCASWGDGLSWMTAA